MTLYQTGDILYMYNTCTHVITETSTMKLRHARVCFYHLHVGWMKEVFKRVYWIKTDTIITNSEE